MLLPHSKGKKSDWKLHISFPIIRVEIILSNDMKNVITQHHVMNINALKLIVTEHTQTKLHSIASAFQIIKSTSTNRYFTTYRLISTE